jgi:hypothetical protein
MERFEDQMHVFKKTDTYVEIKPFLQSLNIINHKKYLNQINTYQ